MHNAKFSAFCINGKFIIADPEQPSSLSLCCGGYLIIITTFKAYSLVSKKGYRPFRIATVLFVGCPKNNSFNYSQINSFCAIDFE